MFNFYKFQGEKDDLTLVIQQDRKLKKIQSQQLLKRDGLAQNYNLKIQKFIVDVRFQV